MDKQEATLLLERSLHTIRKRSYADLKKMVESGAIETQEVVSDSGKSYQIEIQAFWDNKTRGNIRVCGAIDDGGINAFVPVSSDFIMAPDGSFVGE
jgi:hypothetical protein